MSDDKKKEQELEDGKELAGLEESGETEEQNEQGGEGRNEGESGGATHDPE